MVLSAAALKLIYKVLEANMFVLYSVQSFISQLKIFHFPLEMHISDEELYSHLFKDLMLLEIYTSDGH